MRVPVLRWVRGACHGDEGQVLLNEPWKALLRATTWLTAALATGCLPVSILLLLVTAPFPSTRAFLATSVDWILFVVFPILMSVTIVLWSGVYSLSRRQVPAPLVPEDHR
jgi:hypothetical protein